MVLKTDIQTLLDRMAIAYSAGDAAACAEMFAMNAQLHSPFGPAAVGRPAIEELHRDWVADSTSKSFTILDHGSEEALAWCLCRFSEGDVTGDGTSLIVLERQEHHHTWLIRICCLHGDE